MLTTSLAGAGTKHLYRNVQILDSGGLMTHDYIPQEIVYQMPDAHQVTIDKVNEQCYDQCASLWDRFPFPDLLPQLVEKYRNPNLGNRALDIGSGTGILAKWLADQGVDLLCIDPSLEMVKRCRKKGLKTLQCSLQSYQADDPFGMIFAILSLIHIPKVDFNMQIQKLAAMLVPKGMLFLAMIRGSGEGFSKDTTYPRFFAYYSPEEIQQRMAPYFSQKEFHNIQSGHIHYMLFVFEKQ